MNIESLKSSCPSIVSARVGKDELLYVPAGYFVLESTTKGPLCYGVRKSFFLKKDKQAHAKSKELIAGGGRDVENKKGSPFSRNRSFRLRWKLG